MAKDFKKSHKEIFKPSCMKASFVDIGKLPYLAIEGVGEPGSKEFVGAIEALYSVAYTIRMSYKSGFDIAGYYEYVVPPLEGVWSMQNGKEFDGTNKEDFAWVLLLMLPEFADKEVCKEAIEIAFAKKKNELINTVVYKEISGGVCCTMLHVGSFDNESETFSKMEEACKENGYERSSKDHREIYLNDFRKTPEAKLKTVLRFEVAKSN